MVSSNLIKYKWLYGFKYFIQMQIVLWFQVFQSNTNNFHTVVWIQEFLSNINNYMVLSNYFYLINSHLFGRSNMVSSN